MTYVRVAIPVLKGKRRFHLDKGRPWSVVEHAVLAAISASEQGVGELASRANLPRRLVLEIVIRLMRAGWVAVNQRANGVTFSATKAGLAAVDQDELPSVPRRIKRWMNFVIDKVTGTLYRSRELPFFAKHVIEDRATRESLVWMEARTFDSYDEPATLVSTLFEEDEKFAGVDPAGDRLVDRYALVTVRNGVVEGLPPRAPAELSKLVLDAARKAPTRPAGAESPQYQPAPEVPYADRDAPASVHAVFDADDLVLGGREHQEVFLNALRRVRHRLIVHSTFIAAAKFAAVRSLLHDAVKRGVAIDILWGEDEEKTGSRATNVVVQSIRRELETAGLDSALRIHSFSTRSHSKLIVADDGNPGTLFAIVGSCNWLSSGFESFEASVRLRDPRLVAEVLDQIAELTRGSDGHWTELTNEVVKLASATRTQRIPAGRRGDVTIVLGPAHAQYVQKAKNEAARRIFVTSHRLGAATRPAVVVPAVAAVQARGVAAEVYYCVPSGTVSSHAAADLTLAAGKQGVTIRPILEPRLHAKILAWDDDYVLLTSQNWLSADPTEANRRREIGVFIHATGVARMMVERFEAMRRS